jgi:hypothetical protein
MILAGLGAVKGDGADFVVDISSQGFQARSFSPNVPQPSANARSVAVIFPF